MNAHRLRLARSWLVAFAAVMALAAAGAPAATLQPGDDPAKSPVWLKVRASLFGDRNIQPAPAGLLQLEVPARAVDAAVVPVALRTRLAEPGRRVERLVLVIDANPSPVSAIFTFGPAAARAEVETRVRIDDYSHVRAIAELDDGRLYMVTRFVKASGGCSAPAGSDAAAAAATMGRMVFRSDGDISGTAGREPVAVTLAIQHPNHSGLAMDQYTRQFTPAHYVRKVDVTYGGQPAFSADVDFSMSENPNFRFVLQPRSGGGELRATVVDSQERRFDSAGTPAAQR